MTPVAIGVACYVALQLAIGVWVSRRVKTEEDYLLAGRRLGLPLVTLSVFATWFGAEAAVGSSGGVYGSGLFKASAEPLGYALCLFLVGGLLAARLWSERLTTLPDLLRRRFSPATEKVAVVLIVPASVLWAAAQVRAFGQVLSSFSAISVPVAIAIAATVAIVYTVFGGLLADAITDLVQGTVLVLGLGWLTIVIVGELGGLGAALARVPGDRLVLLPDHVPRLEIAETWLVPVLGSLFAQELAQRVMAARSARVARRGTLLGASLYLCVGLLPVLLGLLGPELVGNLGEPEQLLPRLAETRLSTALYVLFLGALVSAILSTVDSTLLVAAGLVSHNVIAPLLPTASERQKVTWARLGVVGFGALAWLLALDAGSVSELVAQASAFGSSGVVVTLLAALFLRRGGAPSALLSLLGGAVAYVAATLAGSPTPFIVSLLAAVVGYLAGLPWPGRAR